MYWLAKGLVERGHQVLMAALPGSRPPPGCRLVEIEKRTRTLEEYSRLMPESLDIVHFMGGISRETLQELPVPALLTMHGNAGPGEIFPRNTVFVSRDHARRHGSDQFVYNGIDPSEFLFEPDSKEDWNLFLSKTSWRIKNLRGAIRYTRKAGTRLRIAGGYRPVWMRLQSWIHPRLSWEGPVSGSRKARLLSRAKALVFPVTWEEPFGLVVAEALISGTPVLATPRGSLPELISDEVGALLKSDEEWIEVLRQDSYSWDPAACRDRAMRKFHYARMAECYEEVYGKILAEGVLNPGNPIGRPLQEGDDSSGRKRL